MGKTKDKSRARRLRQQADLARKRAKDEAVAAELENMYEPHLPDPDDGEADDGAIHGQLDPGGDEVLLRPGTEEADGDDGKAQKDYGMGEMPEAAYWAGGATDFEELDAWRASQDMAEEVRDLTYDFRMLMDNIVNNPLAEDKKAALAALATQFSARVNEAPSEKDAGMSADMDALTDPAAFGGAGDTPGLLAKFKAWLARVATGEPDAATGAKAAAPSAFRVFKQGEEWRWFGIVSNKYRDRDTRRHPRGEIITEAAHKEFVAYLDAHPERAPQLWSWHTPGTAREKRADWWDYTTEGFLCMSGPLTEAEAKQFGPDEELAMSHGLKVLAYDEKNGLIDKYRSFEATELPAEWPANPWTSFGVLQKEAAMAFTPEKRAHLIKRLGEDKVRELEAEPEALGKALELLGAEWKDAPVGEKPEAEAAAAKPAAEGEAKAAPAVDEALVTAVFEAIGGPELKEGLPGLIAKAAKVDALEARVAEQDKTIAALKKSDDEKVAEQFAPRVKPLSWGFQASKSAETALDDEDPEQKELAAAAADGFLAALGPIAG